MSCIFFSSQAAEVNATLVETLLDCVTEDWMCDVFLEYVLGEVANIVSSLMKALVFVFSVKSWLCAECTSRFPAFLVLFPRFIIIHPDMLEHTASALNLRFQ